MPNTASKYDLRTKTSRLKLAVRAKPYFTTLERRRLLGYVRMQLGAAGRWVVSVEVGRSEAGSSLRKQITLGLADDLLAAEPERGILSFAQAQAMAASWDPDKPRGGVTVQDACQAYIEAKRAESGDKYAEDAGKRLRRHVLKVNKHGKPLKDADGRPLKGLGPRPVAALTKDELDRWKNALVSDYGLSTSGANRTAITPFKAALNYAAADPHAKLDDTAWRRGLRLFRCESGQRPHHWSEPQIQKIIKAAYALDSAVGHYFFALYLTGARPPKEVAGLRVHDFDAKRATLHIGKHKTKARTVVLGRQAVELFTRITQGKEPHDLLLLRADGMAWNHRAQRDTFQAIMEACGYSTHAVPYSIRHSHISRSIERGQPLSIISENVGSSVAMLTRHYSHLLQSAKRRVVQKTAAEVSGLEALA